MYLICICVLNKQAHFINKALIIWRHNRTQKYVLGKLFPVFWNSVIHISHNPVMLDLLQIVPRLSSNYVKYQSILLHVLR